jgi:hypothetical protein
MVIIHTDRKERTVARKSLFSKFVGELTKPVQPHNILKSVKRKRKAATAAKKRRERVNAAAQKTIVTEAERERKATAKKAAAKKAAPARRPATPTRPSRKDFAVHRPSATPGTPPLPPGYTNWYGEAPPATTYTGTDDDGTWTSTQAVGADRKQGLRDKYPGDQAGLRRVGLCGAKNRTVGGNCTHPASGIRCAAGHRTVRHPDGASD